MIYIDPKDEKFLQQIAKLAFPDYKGRDYRVSVLEELTLGHTYWDEGTKYEYVAVSLTESLKKISLPLFNPPQFGGPLKHPTINLVNQSVPTCMVERYYGRINYLNFYLAPGSVSQQLTEQTESLSQDEKIVLIATRSLKSSYGGVSDYRFHEANRARGISRKNWEEAVSSLIFKGLLRKNKSITPKGRNLVGLEQL